jgi:hypothetical protein
VPFGGEKVVAYSNTSTLGYLSSTQALADYATLIIDLKKNLTATESPVVVFGGSYGGSKPISSSILLLLFFCSFFPIIKLLSNCLNQLNSWFWESFL